MLLLQMCGKYKVIGSSQPKLWRCRFSDHGPVLKRHSFFNEHKQNIWLAVSDRFFHEIKTFPCIVWESKKEKFTIKAML